MPATTDGAAASQWPDLPPELLLEISGRLDAGADRVRFHAVCRSWHATLDRPLRFPPWRYLPPKALRNISGRLHAAADFARFHAVCWQWHTTLDRPPSFLPWLLAPSDDPRAAAGGGLADQRCRCVFSKTSSLAPGICVRDRRVACADAAAAWLVRSHHEARLVDPLTADRLPFSREDVMKNNNWPDRIYRTVSGDGAIFFYDFAPYPAGARLPPGVDHPYSRFRGAYLRPGEEEWAEVWEGLSTDRCCAAICFYGYILCVDLVNCYIVEDTQLELPDEEPSKVRRCSYLLESTDGELPLLASVLHDASADGPAGLSVSLHALDLTVHEDDAGERLQEFEWVRRDESEEDMSLLGGDVLFLGFPGSFAVDAELFGGEVSGGAAYFVMDSPAGQGHSSSSEPCSVYRYSFHDGSTTLAETLPPGWGDARCMWFLPKPKISRILERTPCSRSKQLRIFAGDLSPKVDSSRLREMFSKHGKVAGARVAYDKRGRSRGFGFVTMATQEGFVSAMAALNAVEEPHRSLINRPFSFFVTLLTLLLIFALCYFIYTF